MITLKEHIKRLQEIIEACPEAADFVLVYGKDDEGNVYEYVSYPAAMGWWSEEDMEFSSHAGTERAVCIN